MGKSNVEIYLRVRPNSKTPHFSSVDCTANKIEFNLPRDESGGHVNNQKVHYEFGFNGVFDNTTTQETIFSRVAEKAVLQAVQGYNATIFAYGQTGSGKTWSITGGISKYADRGIIPRAISRCFQECLARSDNSFQIKISYMEIYNETCYDLLDPKHEGTTLEDLPKVQIRESTKGHLKFMNLHKHVVTNEEEALNLLFLGDTNRIICETPMNKASSRSHCVFTVYINTRPNGAAFVRKSKFHLVDLAGSERIGKTGVHGQILTEAKFINLSLHYLEQVIITLQENPQGHVPYRNSKVTSVLRDSLGGNCKTAMIATVNLDDDFSMESIATCKFAARVAMISNEANINEHTDPKIIIAGLRQQIEMLKADLKEANEKGGSAVEVDTPLAHDDLQAAGYLKWYGNMWILRTHPPYWHWEKCGKHEKPLFFSNHLYGKHVRV
eukprot:Phypoly_transcript_05013.p1 GENE.Phypoly_transcript_05013~~Phypoly_transcript_05013.p1  ORF type:complete len:440 (-),score=45.38 Phypoly_transcript_05013:311-1630(-)